MNESRIVVRVGECAVTRPGHVLYTLGLGSCVAILLHDPEERVAGMAHVLLPNPPNPAAEPRVAKYASTAVPHLVDEILRQGGRPQRLRARLVGGASMFRALAGSDRLQVGQRNIAAARDALQTAEIPIVGEDVGREHGRSVHFHPENGRTIVTSVLHGRVEL